MGQETLGSKLAVDGLPSNIRMERTLLGALLVEPHQFECAAEVINGEDFHLDAHRLIFRAIAALLKAGQSVDYLTIGDFLEKYGRLETVGGVSYVSGLADGMPRGLDVTHYARAISGYSRKRKLLLLGQQLTISALDKATDAETIIAQAAETLHRLGADVAAGYELLPNIGMRRIDEVNAARLRQEVMIGDLTWGLDGLDQLAPMKKKDLVVVGGLSSSGKSALGVQIAVANAEQRHAAGLVVSLEMSKEQNFDRALSMRSGVPYAAFRQPSRLTDADMSSSVEAWHTMFGFKVGIDARSTMTPEMIASAARQFRHKEGALDFVIVDHAQIVLGKTSRFDRRTRAEEVSTICRDCKEIAKGLNVVFILLSQLRKPDEIRPPRMDDLKESGGVIENADIVLGLFRPYVFTMDEKDLGHDKLVVLKNRDGPPGVLKVEFLAPTSRFRETDWFENPDEKPSKKRWGRR